MLADILESVRRRAERVRADAKRWRSAADTAGPLRPFRDALVAPGLSVIAEVKRRSPSAGDIDSDLDPADLASRYAAGGAAAISVLTEPDHFGARTRDLEQARAGVDLPVLRKDFILEEAQVWESRAMGADAILLITAILDDATLCRLMATADAVGLACLVEVHSPDEADRAVAAGAEIIGVNNRDLTTFRVDLSTAEMVRPSLSSTPVTVAESGVSSPEGAGRMARAGFDAVLVGEAAVRSGDPAAFVAALRAAP